MTDKWPYGRERNFRETVSPRVLQQACLEKTQKTIKVILIFQNNEQACKALLATAVGSGNSGKEERRILLVRMSLNPYITCEGAHRQRH